MKLLKVALLGVAVLSPSAVSAQQVTAESWPRLRHIDPAQKAPETLSSETLKLYTDNDFAPFSYVNDRGDTVGISVEIAQHACETLKLKCDVIAKPFAELLPALQSGEASAVISGIKMTKSAALQFATTRPYYISLGRFLIRSGTPLESADIRTFASRRLGYVNSTAHAAFVEQYYKSSVLVPQASEAALMEALRTGTVDAAFTDSLRALYWLRGSGSRACCQVLGSAYIDRSTFSRGLSFTFPKKRNDLKVAFDYALDRLEENNKTAETFVRYVPAALW